MLFAQLVSIGVVMLLGSLCLLAMVAAAGLVSVLWLERKLRSVRA